MTKRQLIFGALVLCTVIVIAGLITFTSISGQDKDMEINAQTEVERIKLEEAAKLQRTKERMKLVPWYKEGSP